MTLGEYFLFSCPFPKILTAKVSNYFTIAFILAGKTVTLSESNIKNDQQRDITGCG